MTSRLVRRLYKKSRTAISAGVGVSDLCWGVGVKWCPRIGWVVMGWKGPNGGLFGEGTVAADAIFVIL